MTKKICIPSSAIVLIFGPSCSGKTTLSRSLADQAPTEKKLLIQMDELVTRAEQKVPSTMSQEAIFNDDGWLLQSMSPGEWRQQWMYDYVMSELQVAVSSHQTVICDILAYSAPHLATWLTEFQEIADHRQIVILKLATRSTAYRAFVKERRAAQCLAFSSRQLIQQRFDFFWATLHQFSNRSMLITEHTITDPRKAEFQFT